MKISPQRHFKHASPLRHTEKSSRRRQHGNQLSGHFDRKRWTPKRTILNMKNEHNVSQRSEQRKSNPHMNDTTRTWGTIVLPINHFTLGLIIGPKQGPLKLDNISPRGSQVKAQAKALRGVIRGALKGQLRCFQKSSEVPPRTQLRCLKGLTEVASKMAEVPDEVVHLGPKRSTKAQPKCILNPT